MNETSGICTISDRKLEPTELLKSIIQRLGPDQCIFLNLATLDKDCAILNRSIVYRGIIEDEKTGFNILFATERNSKNYINMKENPNVAVTFLFPEVKNSDGTSQVWQIRLLDAKAVECNEEQISSTWEKELLYCKIRSHIADCGKPSNHTDLIEKHNRLYKDYKCGTIKLEQTKTFTVFKVSAKCWDFYMSEKCKIGDRIQYRRNTFDRAEKWQIMHVDP